MPRNALAPASANALARRSDPLQSLLVETAAYPQYGDLVGYLSSRRMMPPIEMRYSGGGSFEYSPLPSKDVPVTGVVQAGAPSTVVHELTHAAQRQMSWQYGRLKKKSAKELAPEEQQFIDAYEKLIFTPSEQGRKFDFTDVKTAQSIAPEWAKRNKDYRSTGSELQAFGMGSTVSPNTFNPAPLHVDPTYGTEFSVLLDLASRAQKRQPFTPGR